MHEHEKIKKKTKVRAEACSIAPGLPIVAADTKQFRGNIRFSTDAWVREGEGLHLFRLLAGGALYY